MRDVLSDEALTAAELDRLLDDAEDLKVDRRGRDDLTGRSVGLLLTAAPASTSAAFAVAVSELGGHAITVDETLAGGARTVDTGRVLGRYFHLLVVAGPEAELEAFADGSDVPVVNAGNELADPCQAIADLQTIREYKGTLAGLRLAYLGDGHHVANSLLRTGAMMGMHVAVGSPAGYEPIPQVIDISRKLAADAGGGVMVTANPLEAADDADVVTSGPWSFGVDPAERHARELIFRPFQVGYHVMEAANPDAIVMHGLPAHRGEEIADDVFDGQQSVVWTQAENRLYAAKALLRHVAREAR